MPLLLAETQKPISNSTAVLPQTSSLKAFYAICHSLKRQKIRKKGRKFSFQSDFHRLNAAPRIPNLKNIRGNTLDYTKSESHKRTSQDAHKPAPIPRSIILNNTHMGHFHNTERTSRRREMQRANGERGSERAAGCTCSPPQERGTFMHTQTTCALAE